MSTLPDSSDLLNERKVLSGKPDTKFEEMTRLIQIDEEIIEIYRQAKVNKKDCTHPVAAVNGLFDY